MKSSSEHASTPSRRRLNRRGPQPLALEARLMFDGAAVSTAVDHDTGAQAAPHPAIEAVAPAARAAAESVTSAAPRAAESVAPVVRMAAESVAPVVRTVSDSSSSPAAAVQNMAAQSAERATALSDSDRALTPAPQLLVAADPAADGGRREIAFVDSSITHWSSLVEEIRPGVEVVLIDSRGDGLQQMADYLEGIGDVDAVHVLSHGEAGEVVLGGLHLNADTLSAHAGDIQRIGASLATDGDILLYGCDTGAGDTGATLIARIAQYSGADVAASANDTGAAMLGADWVLETTSGNVNARAFDIAGYDGILALPGAHSATSGTEVYVGGNYIELGILGTGKFGASTKPSGFLGRQTGLAGIGMTGDADGFGVGADLRVDYFMPGTPEEGFYAGYKIGGVATTGKNFASSVTNLTSGNTLSASIVGTIGGKLQVTQVITFDVNDKFFKNTVTLTNTSAGALDNVRFMRSFDPDNTVDKGGGYQTINAMERTQAAGDGVAVVSATSLTGDAYYTAAGNKQAKILYYSSDARARGSFATSGLAPSGMYDANVYDSAKAKSTSGTYDAYISMAMDAGTLAAGASTTFTYYTSLDNRDISTILNEIAAADNKSFAALSEDPASNAGQTVSAVFGTSVAISSVDNTHGLWQYSSNGSSWSNFSDTTGSVVNIASSARLLTGTYSVRFVPDANWNGSTSLSYRVWNGNGGTAGGTADASSGGANFSANAANATQAVNAVNDAPVWGGAPQTLTYTENDAATAIDTAVTLGDIDAANFNGGYLQAQITTNGGAEDQLSVLNQGTSAGQIGVSGSTVTFGGTTIGTIDSTLNGANGAALKITLNTNATVAAAQALARVLAYRDISDAPSTSNRTVTFTMNDGGNSGGGALLATRLATVTVAGTNDAPVASGSVSLTTITEDATGNSGQLVSSFLSATDPDTDPVTGIAITTLSSSRGTWQYSIDNGASWSNVGAVSTSSALLLRTTDRVRFIPDTLNADSASITYKAWDRGNENGTTIAPGAKASVSTSGGTTAYSSGSQTGNLTVTALNDAPVLTAASPAMTGIDENAVSNDGQSIASIVGSTINDVDTGAQQGVAVTALTSGNGTWEYSTNGGSSWTSVGAVSASSALLLRDTDLIRLRPDGDNGTSASFSYDAWDRSSGTQGTKVDASTGGGSTAFSTVVNTASIIVAAVNDAPVLSGAALTFSAITERDTTNTGQTVASLLAGTSSDVDLGAAQGIAVIGKTVAGNGVWEYSTDGGSSWNAVGAVTDNSALLLRATDRVRFKPDNYQGGTATLILRGWDVTSGTAGSTADTATNGDSTAFSSVTATASITVGEVNDPPSFTSSASDTNFTEGDSAVNVGNGLALVDDGTNLTSASVRITGGFTLGDVLAVDTPGGLTVSYNSSTGVLSLSGTASVAVYQAALRSVTFVSSSEDPTINAASRSLEWTATDSANLASSSSANTVSVIATADAPAISGTPATWSYAEDDGVRVVAPSITLSDADDANLSGATVSISGAGYMNDGTETLAANTSGTSVTASFDASTGVLSLSGTDSVANYQRVLRSVTYKNTADYNNPTNVVNNVTLDGTTNTRNFAWEVTDANSDGANGSPTFGAQSSDIANTAVTIINANETPQVTNINGSVSHIQYTEGGAAATLEGLLSVLDDSGVPGGSTSISSALVRITEGLAAGDQLGFFDSAALATAGWTLTGTATSGVLDNGSGTTLTYVFSLDSSDLTITTTSGTALKEDYTAVMQLAGFFSTSDDPTSAQGTRTLIWRVADSFGAQSAVTAAQSTIIDITAVNDAADVDSPSLPANGDVTFIENGATVDLAPGLTLSDADDTLLSQAVVSITGSGFSASQEFLTMPGVSISSSADWSLSNINGTGIDASYDSASGTLTLSGAATLADYQGLLRTVAYGSSDNDPTATASTRTINWTLTDSFGSRLTDADGGANDSDVGSDGSTLTSTVTLLPRNDAPVLAGLGGTVGYTEGASAVALAGAMTLSDVDDSSLTKAQVWISGGFTAGDTLSVAVPGGLTVNYDSTSGMLTLTGTASKATYEAALQSVEFSSSGANPTEIAPSRTVSWQITDDNAAGDGLLDSSVGTTQVTITATDNAASVGSLPGAGTIGYVERSSPVVAAPTLVLADSDDAQLAGATIAITGGATSGDLLSIGAALTGTGIVLDPSSTSTSLVLTGVATLADYQAVMRSITFSSSSDDPTNLSATRTITWSTTSAFSSRLTDTPAGNDSAAGAASVGVTSDITITPLNSAPTIAFDDGTPGNSSDAAVFQQGGAPVYVISATTPNTFGGATAADVDDGQLAGATVQITDSYSSGDDVLSIGTPAGWGKAGNVYSIGGESITVSFDSGTGTLTLSGTASAANYSTLLGYVQYQNASSSPTATGASRELTWTITDANSAGDGARTATGTTHLIIRDINDPPQIDPSTSTVTYDEGDASVALPVITVSDPDPGEVVTVILTLSSTDVGALTTSGGAAYDASTGVWTLTGTVTHVNSALAAVTFVPNVDNDLNATISVEVTDGGEDGAPAALGTIALNVTAANDAPTLTPASPVLTSLVEDDISNGGQQVGAFRGTVVDVDTSAQFGIAITSLNSGNGAWQYSTDGGTTWINVGAVSSASALLLRDTDFIRFVPNEMNGTSATFAYLAWDRSSGTEGTKVDTSTTGGSSAFSGQSDTVSIVVSSLNDAPALTDGDTTLANITEDNLANIGTLISDLTAGKVTDVDAGAQKGIAITGLSSGNGTWQYSLDDGALWSNVTTASAGAALLLRDTDRLRFVPDTANGTSVSFDYRAWDSSTGAAGGTADTSATGAAAAFSTEQNTVSLAVDAVNDAPVLAPGTVTLTPISEDDVSNTGQTVASIVTTTPITDVDAGAQAGIAVTSLTNGGGTWQYSLDGGTTWSDIGSVSTSGALLLRDTDKIRFLPDGQNATAGGFSYRAWDGSAGTAGSSADVSVNGGTSAFSLVQNDATIEVSAVNDAPVLAAAAPIIPALSEDETNNVGVQLSTLLGASVTDVDQGATQGIAITSLNSGNGIWQYSLNGGNTWINLASAAPSEARLLRDTDFVRFLPNTQNATPASFIYKAWDQATGSAGAVADTTVSGGTSAFSASDNTARVDVVGVNDAPVLLNDAPSLITLTEDDVSNGGQTVASFIGSTISDVDSQAVSGIAVTSTDSGNGNWQYSLDSGGTWIDVGSVSSDNALLLRDTDLMRFVPNGENATSGSFSYRAWDRVAGDAGSTADVTVNSGTTPFSLVENTAQITVTAVNDAPINDVVPTFSGGTRTDGSLRQDGVLTADPGTWHDLDAGDPIPALRYQWQVADDASGTNLRDITDATASTYALTGAEIGKYVRVKITGGDGKSETDAISAFTLVTNRAPTSNLVLITQETTESVPIQFTVPADAFGDPDSEDTLYYSATLADGSALPAWLTFDPITRTFSGTPLGADVGVFNVRVIASDHGTTTSTSEFTLRVLSLPVNQADTARVAPPLPPPVIPVADTSVLTPHVDAPFIRLADTPSVSVNATDSWDVTSINVSRSFDSVESAGGLTRPEGFRIVVEPSRSNDVALSVLHPLEDKVEVAGSSIEVSIPIDTFVHTQSDALITLFAVRADGRPLPRWLRFDAATGKFSGTPPDGYEGELEVKVIARDNLGNDVSTSFRFKIQAQSDKTAFRGKAGLSSVLMAQAFGRPHAARDTRLSLSRP